MCELPSSKDCKRNEQGVLSNMYGEEDRRFYTRLQQVMFRVWTQLK